MAYKSKYLEESRKRLQGDNPNGIDIEQIERDREYSKQQYFRDVYSSSVNSENKMRDSYSNGKRVNNAYVKQAQKQQNELGKFVRENADYLKNTFGEDDYKEIKENSEAMLNSSYRAYYSDFKNTSDWADMTNEEKENYINKNAKDTKKSKLKHMFEFLGNAAVNPTAAAGAYKEMQNDNEQMRSYSLYYKDLQDMKYGELLKDNSVAEDVKAIADRNQNAKEEFNQNSIDITDAKILAENRNRYIQAADEAEKRLESQGLDVSGLVNYYENKTATAQRDEFVSDVETFSNEHPVIASGLSALPTLAVKSNLEAMGKAAAQSAVSTFSGKYTPADNTDIAFYPSLFQSTVRGTTAQNIAESQADGSFSQKALPFLYQTGMSMIDSSIAAVMPKGTGSALLAMNAFGQAYNDAAKNNLDASNAFMTAGANAVNEYFFEKYSIENLKGIAASVSDSVLKRTLKQMGVEASEEALTEIANIAADAVINQNQSDIAKIYKDAISKGYDEEEALQIVLKSLSSQVFEAALGGALSGGVMGGAGSVYSASKQNAYYKQIGTQMNNNQIKAEVDYGLNSDLKSSNFKIADKIQNHSTVENTESENNDTDYSDVSAKELGKLRIKNSQSYFRNSVTEAVSNETDAKKIAKVIRDMSNGKIISKRQAKIIRDSDAAINAINESLDTSFTKDDITADTLTQISQNMAAGSTELFDIFAENITDKTALNTKNSETRSQRLNSKEKGNEYNFMNYHVPATLRDNSQVLVHSSLPFAQDGNEIRINTSDGYKSMVDFNFNNPDLQSIANSVIEDKNIGIAGMNTIFANYTPDIARKVSRGKGVEQYLGMATIVYNEGLANDNVDFNTYLKRTSKIAVLADVLTEEIAREIYDAGRNDRTAYDAKQSDLKSGTETKQSDRAAGEYKNETGRANELDSVYALLSKELGYDIVLVESKGDNVNGYINPGSREIYITESEAKEYHTLIHEVTHYIKLNNAEDYSTIEKSVLEWFKKENGVNEFNTLRKKYLDVYNNNSAGNTYEDINEEITCDIMADIFSTEQGINNFAEWVSNKSPKEQKSIKAAFKRFFEKLRNIINKLLDSDSLSFKGYDFAEMAEIELDKMSRMWLSALDKATTNAKQKNNTAENGSVKYALKPYTEEQIANWSNSKNIVIYKSQLQLQQFIDDARNHNNLSKKMYFGIIADNVADLIYEKTGIDVHNYNAVLRADSILKIFDSHGNELKEAQRGQRAIIDNDILLLPELFGEIDNVEYVGKYTKMQGNNDFINVKSSVEPTITIGLVVQNKQLDIRVQTMYATKKGNNAAAVNAQNSPLPLTPETNSGNVSFDTNVPQSDTDVNNHSMQNNTKYSLRDNEGNELSKQQQEYFKDSKVRDENGNLLVMYHQTSSDFTVFNTNNQKAGKFDSEMPTGIFLKPTENDIGLAGKKQMKVYVNITNPLSFYNRENAVKYFERNVKGYKDALNDIARIDKEYQQKYDEADLRDDELYKKLFEDFKSKKITGEEFKEGIENTETKRILNEWTKESDNARLNAKLLIDSYFSDSEYDGMIVEKDAGSFGRNVKSYIAFDSNQIKNVDNATPTSNADIRYSLNIAFDDKTDFTENINKVISMDSVSDLSGNEFAKGEVDLITQVSNYFDSVGNVAHSKYGDVVLNRTGAKSSLGHGIGRNKAIAFAAVPQVIEKGEIINYHVNHKGRNYDTAVFSAPITINNIPYYMAIVVTINKNSNEYYLHEVSLQKNKDAVPFKTGNSNTATPSGNTSSIYSLLEKLQNVNGNSMQNNAKYSLKENDLQNEFNNMQTEIIRLRNKISELKSSDEYNRMVSDISASYGAALDIALSNYGKWLNTSGLNDAIRDLDELQKKDKVLRQKLSEKNSHSDSEKKSADDLTDEDIKEYVSMAEKHFGITDNYKLAGYLTVNGKMLDFSDGQRSRVQDHREINDVLDFLDEDANFSDGLIAFMNMGNIRLNAYGIDIAQSPNEKQIPVLQRMFDKLNGEVTVDFSNRYGDPVESIDYIKGTSSEKIINDINLFYKNGKLPNQSTLSQFHTRYSIDVERENTQLKRKIEKLEKANEYFKQELKLSHGRQVTQKEARHLAQTIKEKWNSTLSVKELTNMFMQLADYGADGGFLAWNDFNEKCNNIAKAILDSQKIEIAPERKAVLDYIRGFEFKLSASQKAECANAFGSFGEYYTANFGSIKIRNNAQMYIDEVWQEWSERYPEYFDKNISDADMPIVLSDLIKTLKDTTDNEYHFDRENAEDFLTAQIMDAYYELPMHQTFADRKQQEINNLKFKHKEALEQVKAEQKAEYNKALSKVKEVYSRKHQKLWDNYIIEINANMQIAKAERERINENEKKRKYRRAIHRDVNKLISMLVKPDKNNHIPSSMLNSVKSLVSVMKDNFDLSVGANASEKRNLLRASIVLLEDSWNEKIDSGTSLSDENAKAYDEYLKMAFDWLKKRTENKTISQLDSDELRELSKVITVTLKTVENGNKLFVDAKNQSIESSASEISSYFSSKKKDKLPKAFFNNIAIGTLKPAYFFEILGSDELARLYKNIENGEDVYAKRIMETEHWVSNIREKHNYEKWNLDEKHIYETQAGDKLEFTLKGLMGIYANSLRKQAKEHLLGGGFKFDIKVKAKQKWKDAAFYEDNNNATYKLNETDLVKIASMLSSEQIGYVKDVIDYLSTTVGGWGNEVTRRMYDIELYKETSYYPIVTDKNFVSYSSMDFKAMRKLANSSFTKQTVTDAQNPIVLMDFEELAFKHIDQMAKYSAFTEALTDFDRVYHTFSHAGDNYQAVKSKIEAAYGKNVSAYIDKLLEDVNGNVIKTNDTGYDKWLSRFKKGAVLGSLSTVIQQPSAVVRAMSEIDPKYFTKWTLGLKNNTKAYEEIMQYAPVAFMKQMGSFDTGTSGGTVEYLIDKKTPLKKIDNALSYGAEKADQVTWVHIWNAALNETKALHEAENLTDEQLKAIAGNRFSDVVRKTQVYDSTFSRSQLMRNKDVFSKMVTSFMAEPTTTLNMAANAIVQVKRGKMLKKKGAMVMVSLVLASALNTLLKSLVYAARNDDEDKTYFEKYLSSLPSNFIDELNPLNNIALVKDIYSICKGYDIERADMSVFSDWYKAWDQLGSDTVTTQKKIEDVVSATAKFFGVPIGNAYRDGKAIFMTLKGEVTSDMHFSTSMTSETIKEEFADTIVFDDVLENVFGLSIIKTYTKNEKIYRAILSDDTEIYNRLTKDKEKKQIASIVRKNYLEAEDDEKQQVEKFLISTGEFEKVDFSKWIGNTYSNDLLIEKLNKGNYVEIKAYIDERIKAKVDAGSTEKAAISSIKSALSKEYKEDFINGDADRRAEIITILTNTGLYGDRNETFNYLKKNWK